MTLEGDRVSFTFVKGSMRIAIPFPMMAHLKVEISGPVSTVLARGP